MFDENQLSEQERKDLIAHREILNHVQAVMATKSGRAFCKYLCENFQVGQLPARGTEGNLLHDELGFLRAGEAIWALICQASPEMASTILAEVTKGRYV